MNEPEDPLRTHFQRQRAQDESSAPSFHAMSARARTSAASPRQTPHLIWLGWAAPTAAAIVCALIFLRPQPGPSQEYSARLAALLTELDTPAFAQTALPSDLLPAAFP